MNRLLLIASVLGLLLFATPAAAQRALSFATGDLPDAGAIAIPMTSEDSLTGVAEQVDQATGGRLSAALAEAGFTGAEGEMLTLYGLSPYARIDLVGVGAAPVNRVAAEDFGGRVAALNNGASDNPLSIIWTIDHETEADAARVAFGFMLGDYRFDRYKQDRIDDASRAAVTILTDDETAAGRFESDLAFLAESIYLARDLASEPGNVIYPESFVDRVKRAFRGVGKTRLKVLDEKDLADRNMGALLGVGSGSDRPPRLLVIEYMGGGREAPLVMVGKGITFDTGGISLKENDNMWFMKADMSGAAVVSGTVLAAARRGAPVNLVALAALAENMPGGSAIRPGDVLTSMSGRTIEIKSTDAEGRLVLSDAVWFGQLEYRPDVLIDVATLTGSVTRAVGDTYSGLFSTDEALVEGLKSAAATAGEPTWRLPLDPVHYEQIASEIADVRNGGGTAGASTGAAFIGSFIREGQSWAHLDIAGMDYTEQAKPTVPAGYTGYGIRLLDQYIRDARE